MGARKKAQKPIWNRKTNKNISCNFCRKNRFPIAIGTTTGFLELQSQFKQNKKSLELNTSGKKLTEMDERSRCRRREAAKILKQ